MLVLTRRANQSIMIGDDVVVTVLDVRGDQVRIGIKAPRSVDVHREEVFIALQREGGREPAAPAAELASSEPEVIDLDRVDAVETATANAATRD